MSQYVSLSGYEGWTCADCEQLLVPGKVDVSYLGNTFSIEVLKCPNCGLALIPEELALGKFAEVEITLEDK